MRVTNPRPLADPSKSGGKLPIVPKSNNPFASGLASSLNITVNAIDGEGAARAVAKVLNSSAARSNPALNYQAVKAAAG